MIYASSKDGLRKKLDGVYTEVQCTDLSEVSYETVLDKVCFDSYIGYSHDQLSLPNKSVAGTEFGFAIVCISR